MKTLQTILLALSILILTQMHSYSQFENKTHPETGSNMLIGNLQIADLVNEDGFESLELEEAFEADEQSIQLLAQQLQQVDIVIYIGTWCSDSQHQFPQIISLLKAAKYPIDKIQIIGLDHEKKGVDNIEKKHDILYVPTVIFLRNNVELGRMVEMPNNDLLTDFLEITK